MKLAYECFPLRRGGKGEVNSAGGKIFGLKMCKNIIFILKNLKKDILMSLSLLT
jgi:hypothetical protein